MSAQHPKNGVMLILGDFFGMGALIQSTVNSIWLARKFNKAPVIFWGKSCLYTDKATGGNTYTRLFREPASEVVPRFPARITVYPAVWMPFDRPESVETIDSKAERLRRSNDMELRDPGEINTSSLCIVYQYMTASLAMHLVRCHGHAVSDQDFERECAVIFAEYFQPREKIQRLADDLWGSFFGKLDESVFGMHLRGSDKIGETALPSPERFVGAVRSMSRGRNLPAIYVATDSALCLGKVKSALSDYALHYQTMERSSGVEPLHYRAEGALQNAISVIVDVMLLCRCDKVFAFPGSQIYSWLRRKRDGEQLKFALVEIRPSPLDWIRTAFRVLTHCGWADFLRFCRIQKSKVRGAMAAWLKT